MKTTDMMELMNREELLTDELAPYVRHDGAFGPLLHHPLVIEIFFRPTHCALVNERFRYKVKERDRAAREGRWETYVFVHERPYRVQALAQAVARGAKNIERLVAQTWIDSENIYQNKAAWKMIWSSLPSPRDTMDANERVVYDCMPETVTIHRGIRRKSYSPRGMSWTRDKERAVWFAHRWKQRGDKPVVLTAEVGKKNVLAFFMGRGEEEIVALPKYLKNVRT